MLASTARITIAAGAPAARRAAGVTRIARVTAAVLPGTAMRVRRARDTGASVAAYVDFANLTIGAVVRIRRALKALSV